MIQNIPASTILKNKNLQIHFLNSRINGFSLKCNIYKGNFYSDTFNYFLIDNNYKTFKNLFTRDFYQDNEHYFTNNFFIKLKENVEQLKEFKNIFLLGSSAGNNYYSNLIQFIPRIFYIKDNNIKIAIHRNSSVKFRNFIKYILKNKKINFTFVYLDDGFYNFIDCQFPQFFNIANSNLILKKFLKPKSLNSKDKKIYVTREDSAYRRIVNEADIIPILRSKGYKVINPQLYRIDQQIQIFSEADKIIGAHGSNLSNIIFCKPETEIFEIGPEFNKEHEKIFENRYKILAKINNLKYKRLITDTVPVENHTELSKKYINKKILNNSNYYKNLIVKLNDIKAIK